MFETENRQLDHEHSMHARLSKRKPEPREICRLPLVAWLSLTDNWQMDCY